MAEALVQTVKPLMEQDVLTVEKVNQVSKALVPVRIWVVAMLTYHEVLKIVNPKRKVVAEMNAKLEIVMGALREKQAKVREIDEKLQKLTNE